MFLIRMLLKHLLKKTDCSYIFSVFVAAAEIFVVFDRIYDIPHLICGGVGQNLFHAASVYWVPFLIPFLIHFTNATYRM